MYTASKPVALFEFKKQARVRLTKGRPGLAVVGRSHLAADNINGIEICGLLGNYTASCGNYLPTFRKNVSVPSSRVKIPRGKKD